MIKFYTSCAPLGMVLRIYMYKTALDLFINLLNNLKTTFFSQQVMFPDPPSFISIYNI